MNQLAYPHTWLFILVAVICGVSQLNYLNKVAHLLLLLVTCYSCPVNMFCLIASTWACTTRFLTTYDFHEFATYFVTWLSQTLFSTADIKKKMKYYFTWSSWFKIILVFFSFFLLCWFYSTFAGTGYLWFSYGVPSLLCNVYHPYNSGEFNYVQGRKQL